MKRAFDLVASVVGLILLSPVMAVIGILVKRDSEGPAIFRQERVGMRGEPFILLKFRSMAAAPLPAGPLVTASTDTRITKVGTRLRACKLDELPQLINVARGEMSIVGPRPEVARYVAMWSDEDRRIILSVRPGITDPATLQLRHEERLLAAQPDPEAFYVNDLLPRKTTAYVQYALNRTLGGDVRTILATIASVARQ